MVLCTLLEDVVFFSGVFRGFFRLVLEVRIEFVVVFRLVVLGSRC